MIRGKKNFLPMGQLQLGFGLMFKLDDESIERHQALRKQLQRESVQEDEDDDDETVQDEEIVVDSSNASDEESSGSDVDENLPNVELNLKSLRLSSINEGDEEFSGRLLSLKILLLSSFC